MMVSLTSYLKQKNPIDQLNPKETSASRRGTQSKYRCEDNQLLLPPLTTPEPGPERPPTPVLEDLECSICKEEFSTDRGKQPRTLTCGHTFCTECIESLMFRRVTLHFFPDRNNNNCCPMCRAYFTAQQIDDVPISYSLLNVASNIKRQKDFKVRTAGPTRKPVNAVGFCEAHNSPKQFWCLPCKLWICGACAFLSHKEQTCSVISVDEIIATRKKLHESEHTKTIESSNLRLAAIIQASDVCKTALDSTASLIKQLEESLRIENARFQNLQRVKENIRERSSTINRGISNLNTLSEKIKTSTDYTEFIKASRTYQDTVTGSRSSKKSYIQFPRETWTKSLLLECFMEHSHNIFAEEVENNQKRYFKVTARWPDLCVHSSNGALRLPHGTIILQLSDILSDQCSTFFLDLCFASDIEIRLHVSLHEMLSEYVSSYSIYSLGRRGNCFVGKSFFKLDVDPVSGSTIMWVGCHSNGSATDVSEEGAESHYHNKIYSSGTVFVPISAISQSLCSVFGILLNSSYVRSSRRYIEIGLIKDDLQFFQDNLKTENIFKLKIKDCGCQLKLK